MKIVPNQLSLLRVAFALVLPILLIREQRLGWVIVEGILFSVCIATDWWDGYLARKYSLITSFGKIIDPVADKILILGVMGSFAYLRLYEFGGTGGIFWIALIFIREIGVTVIRLILLSEGRVVPAEKAGKVKMVFQILSIYLTFVFLLARAAEMPRGVFLSVLASLHFLGIAAANIVTVVSGVSFLRHVMSRRVKT
jgi:CDP-diacylglycerol---glycerol-3-phosphate 3-phosphatidyltransferase